MIEFENISIRLNGKDVLRDISFTVRRGEVFCIMGESGVGKSVLIKQLVGLLRPDTGKIRFDGEEVTGMNDDELLALRKKCGMVFQFATLFDSMSCLDNVALPIRKHLNLPLHRARLRALHYLTELSVEHLADRDPSSLGPGLRKLVAIARTLTLDPEAVLYDEPTTGLDPLAARKLDALISGKLASLGLTQIVVSHDVRSIVDIADRLAMLHEGEIRFLGTVDELSACVDPVVRRFIEGRPEGRPSLMVPSQ